jgi:hypothetical protein
VVRFNFQVRPDYRSSSTKTTTWYATGPSHQNKTKN